MGDELDKRKSLNDYFSSVAIYAIEQTKLSEKRLMEKQAAIVARAADIYSKSEVRQTILSIARNAHPIFGISRKDEDALRNTPETFGTLEGIPLGSRRAHARNSAALLADEMNEYADEKVIFDRYEKLYLLALEAQRQPDIAAKEDYVDLLRHEIDYCDATRDGRQREHERSRAERPSPGWPPAQPSRSQGEPKDTARAGGDWWRDTGGPKFDPAHEETHPDAERSFPPRLGQQGAPRGSSGDPPPPPPRFRDVDPENRTIALPPLRLKPGEVEASRDWWRPGLGTSRESEAERERLREQGRERERERER